MYKSVFNIDGSKQQDITDALEREGFKPASMNRAVPASEIRDIIGTIGNRIRRSLANGRAELIPRERREFSNGEDRISVIDFDIQQNQVLRPDPVLIVYERRPKTTSFLVQEILEEVVTVDVIKSALLSTTGRKFRTSVNDLARLRGESPSKVYERCMKTLLRSCVSGFRRLDLKESDLLPQKALQMMEVPV